MRDLIKQHYLNGLSIRSISKRAFELFGKRVSTNLISRILKEEQIEFRPKSEEIRKTKSKLDINTSFINEEIIEWIDGLMLGDGGISFTKDYAGSRICLSSSQKEWTDYSMIGLKPYSPSESKISGKISKKSPNAIWGSRTLWHPDIANQARRWYSCGGTKTIVPIDVRITKTSGLLWYLGDGSITTTDRNSTVVRLATCSFTADSIENILIPKLKELGISCHRTLDKNDILIDSDSIIKFFNFIGEKSPIPCYDYKFKIPEWRKRIKLSDIFSSKEDKWRAMYYLNKGDVNSTRSPGGRLVLLEEKDAEKLKDLVSPKGVHIKEIVETKEDLWRTRKLISSGVIKSKKSIIDTQDVGKLKSILLEENGKPIVSHREIDDGIKEYRVKGFPYYALTDKRISKAKEELDSCTPSLPYFWEGRNTELASCFFPHIFECRKKGKMSALEFFNNDKCLSSAIEKVICLYSKTSDARIRQLCRNHHLSSRINNFPPRVTKAILLELCNGKDIEVLDPCCGFGGRLLGSMSCLNVKKYVGIDLSLPTYEGNQKMIDRLGFKSRATVYCGDCLELMDGIGKFDVILTSPPFLDVEEYIGVPVETNYNKWKSSFIEPLLRLSRKCLKEDGRAAFYLEDISGTHFVEDFCNIAISSGFNIEKSIKFKAPHNEYNRSTNKDMRELSIKVFSCKNLVLSQG